MDSVVWGYILIGPGRPERSTQRKVMTYAGANMSETGTVWEDKLPPRATRPQASLSERNMLILAAQNGDMVHVAALLCMGASGADAAWFAGQLGRKGASIVIHGDMREFAPGDDLTSLADDFDRERNNLHVKRSRAKARGKPKV
jgi:hypothetical protein